MTAYVGCRVRITTDEGDFAGSVFALEPNVRRLTLDNVALLPSGKKVRGIRHFFGDEIDSLEVVGEPGTEDTSKRVRPVSTGASKTGVPYQLIPEGSTLPGVTIITAADDVFQGMVSELWEEGIFGMALFGPGHERFGNLSLVLIRTMQRTYLIDALLAAPAIFVEGLATVLESNEVLKVIHDCRWVSNLLYHQFSVKLANVFDTQVADALVNKQRTGGLSETVGSLADCLLAHLGEDLEQVVTMNQLETAVQVDDWMERPLKDEVIDFALESVKHLLTLRRALLKKLFAEFNIAVDLYLTAERNSVQTGKAVTKGKVKHLPPAFRNWEYKLPAYLEAEHNKMADRLDDRTAALPGDNLLRKKAVLHQDEDRVGTRKLTEVLDQESRKEGMASSTDSAVSSQDGENEELPRRAELRGATPEGRDPGESASMCAKQPREEPTAAGIEDPRTSRMQNGTCSTESDGDTHLLGDGTPSFGGNKPQDSGGTTNSVGPPSDDHRARSPRGGSDLAVCFGRGRPRPKTRSPPPGTKTIPTPLTKTSSPPLLLTHKEAVATVPSGARLSDAIRWQKGRGRGEPLEREPHRNERFVEEPPNGPHGIVHFQTRASVDFPTSDEIKDMEQRALDRRRLEDYDDSG